MKSRIFLMKKLFEENTDDNHIVTIAEISAYLAEHGVQSSRSTILRDIEFLRDLGVDIVRADVRKHEYFLGQRHFELMELKLLVDAVGASRFISPKKSAAIIGKLTALTSVHLANGLQRHFYIDRQVKRNTTNLLVNIDKIHQAINDGLRITFKYYDYAVGKKRSYKHARKVYTLSPYGLIWNSDNYYVVGFSETHNDIASFRVDRIAVAEITEIKAVPPPDSFDIAKYYSTIFQMFGGKVETVTLKCRNSLYKNVIDRFGDDVESEAIDDEYFSFTAPVAVSPTFFSWVFTFGGDMTIIAPETVQEAYRQQLSAAILAL